MIDASTEARSSIDAASTHATREQPVRTALRRAGFIAGTYAVVATLWIWLSDRMLVLWVTEPGALAEWSAAKGTAFVVITSLMLLALMVRAFGSVEQTSSALAAMAWSLRAQRAQLSAVLSSARDGIVTVDGAGRIALVNPAAKAMMGAQGDLVGLAIDDFLVEPLTEAEGALRLTVEGADGTQRTVEASVARLHADEGELRTLVLRDVSERRRYEEEIERLNRLYSALSQVNQAIVRSSSVEELLDRACHVLGEQGGLKRVRVVLDRDEPAPPAKIPSWGDDDTFIDRLELPLAELLGAPKVSGEPFVSNDVAKDFASAIWLPEAERRELRAFGCFPIERGGERLGQIDVFVSTPGYFQDQEIALLRQAASDIAFALSALEQADERRRAEAAAEEERMFSHVMLESMPGITYFYDDSGRFLRWNQHFEAVSGYSGDEIATMHPIDFFAPEERELLSERIGEVFERGESSVEAPFLTKAGAKVPYFFTGRSVEFQGRRCLVGVGIDITKRLEAEAALRELAATLEQRIAERTSELELALVRAEAADRLKSAFLATMSHELRTPLNSIIGFTGILLQRLAGPLNEEQARQLGMVRSSSRHLLALINDVLDLSKIEAGQLEVLSEPFDLRASIESAVATIRPIADAKALVVTATVAPEVGSIVGDRRRVEQILLNLLTNAIKFTERGQVTLDARVGLEDGRGSVARIAVSDTGIGIEEADLASLFHPFRQIDTGLARQHEGTGLGLAICRRLVDLMGGDITVSSAPARGSVFTVTLPVRPPHEEEAISRGEDPRPAPDGRRRGGRSA